MHCLIAAVVAAISKMNNYVAYRTFLCLIFISGVQFSSNVKTIN